MNRTDCEGFHRRDFMQVGAAGVLGLTLADVLRSDAKAAKAVTKTKSTPAKAVILVWLAGGPATIDMWDNKPEAPEGIRGEFKSIATSAPGMQLAETLPLMSQIGDKVSLVRSLHHTIPSHAPATVFMTTGNKPTAALQYPSIGSIAAKLLPVEQGVPPYVSFADIRGGAAGGPGYLGTGYSPFFVEGNGGGKGKNAGGASLRVRGISLPSGFSLDELENRDKLLRSFDAKFAELDNSTDLVGGLDTFHQQALDILRSDKTQVAFDLAKEKDKLRERYGSDAFGQSALAARRLIEAGVRFTTISTGGWDTHADTFKRHKTTNMPQLDRTLSALIADLDDRGMLDSTIVLCAGEFGRTPKINPKAGRDHWARSMAACVAGGGLKRGYVHGSTDASGMAPATEPVTPDDLASTIFQQLGVENNTELQTPTGRPVQLFREGRAIEKLIA